MITASDIRRATLQALYQFDSGRTDDAQIVRESLDESAGSPQLHDDAFALATEVWETRQQADDAIESLTPEWPTYRQPVIDRNILRLGWFEITTGRTPPKVAINEAVELAREFSTDKSPMFINGVLDKIYKQHRDSTDASTPTPAPDPQPDGAP